MSLEYKTKTEDFILTTWITLDNQYLTMLETKDKVNCQIGYKKKNRTLAKLSAIKCFIDYVSKSNTSTNSHPKNS